MGPCLHTWRDVCIELVFLIERSPATPSKHSLLACVAGGPLDDGAIVKEWPIARGHNYRGNTEKCQAMKHANIKTYKHTNIKTYKQTRTAKGYEICKPIFSVLFHFWGNMLKCLSI